MRFKKDRISKRLDETAKLSHRQSGLAKAALFLNFGALAGVFYWASVGGEQGLGGVDSFRVLDFLVLLVAVNSLLWLALRGLSRQWGNLQDRSRWDPVTGTLNRIDFEEILDAELRGAGRYHYSVTLCLLDLDRFRAFNDELGRERGDQLLHDFGHFMRGAIRFTDAVARAGSDEFFVLLPHTDLLAAEKFISRILILAGERVDASFSAGITPYRAGETSSQFLTRVRLALDQARREWKNKICCVIAGDDTSTVLRF